MRSVSLLLLFLVLASTPVVAERMTPELLWKLGRVGGGMISPEGIGDQGPLVAYTVKSYELAENKGTTDLWVVPLRGGNARRLAEKIVSLWDLQWVKTPRGVRLFAVAIRASEDDSHVWSIDPQSSQWTQVTNIDGGIDGLVVSPTGDKIAFTRSVKIDKDVVDLYPDLPKADAKIIDQLMFRHWNVWRDGTYSHVHVASLDKKGVAGEAIDLMAGRRFECPVPPFGGSEQFAWSPDGTEVAFTAKVVNNWAQSTDSDIYLAKADGTGRLLCVTVGMDGYDNDPSYSPDGKYIAFHSMERPGFESDRSRVMLFDRTGRGFRELTEGLDQAAHGTIWSRDSKRVFFYSERNGTNQIFTIDLRRGDLKQVTDGRYNWSPRAVSPDSDKLVVARMSMLRPYELFSLELDGGEVKRITDVNGDIYARLELPRIEERWIRSVDQKKVHNWVIYPPDFDPKKKWPMITYCQGGPQGQIGQWFSFRWNFHLMAAQGYVVLAVNRRGLPGFGREWNDEISKNWGDKAMQDILAATDSMTLESYIDPQRVGAVGASFGGYTVYWLMGNHEKRFCTMIAHCGVFNLESMYGSTEELFFVDWDLGGPYWKSAGIQRDYDRFSPHRFVRNWETPLLVIHGEKDFRVPLTQGIEAFTAAQVQGVPSRFLYFPSEGHWVLSPQNGVLWHRVFFDWLGRSCKKQ